MRSNEGSGTAAREPLQLAFTAADELGAARTALRTWLRGAVRDEHSDEVLLASGEALTNAFEHGRAPVSLTMKWTDRTLDLTIRDAGSWAGPAARTEPPGPRGRGIPIMSALSDNLTFDTTDGTVVRFNRRFEP